MKTLVYVCISENTVVGVLGLGTSTQRALKFNKDNCKTIFGNFRGNIIYNMLHKTTETPAVKNDTDLYIDYLATDSNMRNKGIATELLTFAFDLPKYKDCYIEVLSKNTIAAMLYKKLGFSIYKKSFHIFTFLQRLGNPILMKKSKFIS